jgi:hypothetical protein
MALDWTRPSQLDSGFDTQFLDFGDPSIDQSAYEYTDFFEDFHEPLELFDDDALRSDLDRLADVSAEPWPGLGCTCGLVSITCSEHNNAAESNGRFSPLIDTTCCNDTEDVQEVQPDDTAISNACDDDDPRTEDSRYAPRPSKESQGVSKPQKKRRTKISIEAKRTLEKYFASNPYPTVQELRMLSRSTKLSQRTISMWFSNIRARKKISHRK